MNTVYMTYLQNDNPKIESLAAVANHMLKHGQISFGAQLALYNIF